MAGARFVGEASIAGAVIFRAGYPGLVPSDSLVSGELFQVPGSLWESLDNYEGPGYVRTLNGVQVDGATVKAWVYWLR